MLMILAAVLFFLAQNGVFCFCFYLFVCCCVVGFHQSHRLKVTGETVTSSFFSSFGLFACICACACMSMFMSII